MASGPHTRSLSSSKFRNYTHSEPRFRALLTEGDARVHFHREVSDRIGEALA
jgi:hypothetical protein